MTIDERDELRRLADELDGSAARLPTTSRWRGRMLQEARLFRAMAEAPATAEARTATAQASGLRLIPGEAS